MTVARVWGRIQSKDAVLISQDGDLYEFEVPPWATSPIIAEFWAEDEAGNVTYRSAVLEVEAGTIKCLRWLDSDGVCTMEPIMRSVIDMECIRAEAAMIEHICPQMEA